MNVKISALVAFGKFYDEIQDIPVKPSLAYKLNLIKNVYNTNINFFQDTFTAILNKYAEKDENGNIITEDNGMSFKLLPSTTKLAEEELNNLNNMDIILPNEALIELEDLGLNEISPKNFANLFPFMKRE